MKTLKNELQMYLAEKLLAWSAYVTPNNDEGRKLKVLLLNYVKEKLLETNNSYE